MDFSELAQARCSVRRYSDRPVEEEKLELILEAACSAPTAANKQPFRLFVVQDEASIKGVAEAAGGYMRDWLSPVPIIIVACGIPEETWVRQDGFSAMETDVAIVMAHVILQAADLGLGTCWIADFQPDLVREALRLGDNMVPLALTPVGYPAHKPPLKRRRQLSELVTRGPLP